MIRKILCGQCGDKQLPRNPEDAAEGWKIRLTRQIGTRPDKDKIALSAGDTVIKWGDMPSLVCDNCGAELPDGTEIVAATYWRDSREGEPGRWEDEYLRKATS